MEFFHRKGLIIFMKTNRKTIIILILNVAFYALCDVKYLPIIAFEILASFWIYCQIVKRNKAKKVWLISGIVLEVIILGFFKYADFFLKGRTDALRILMPLGISYYTFKILSFLIDAYRQETEKHVTLMQYATYVSFFPQIMCGPISRTDEIIPQLNRKDKITEKELTDGFGMIISGLFKKMVIADRLSAYTETIFMNPVNYPALASWIAAFLFSIQIYCDFAGYSEIAIGICKILGFQCRANFDKPYLSCSIKEFWNRWHKSLSTWLRDYIYIPLGGNRCGRLRKNINILITFFVSGIWHGNGLNFICWGMWHGLLNILSIKKSDKKIVVFFQTVGTFICVTFGWIMFKAESFTSGIKYILNMFSNLRINYNIIVDSIIPFTGDYSCLSYFIIVCTFILILFIFELREYTGNVKSQEKSLYFRSSFYLLATLLFGIVGQSSFLYANF